MINTRNAFPQASKCDCKSKNITLVKCNSSKFQNAEKKLDNIMSAIILMDFPPHENETERYYGRLSQTF